MTAKDAFKDSMNMSNYILHEYIGDLSDSELTQRPAAGLNPLAWQLGHLIASERSMISELGHKMPDLPAGFEAAHSKEAAASNDTSKYLTKDKYLGLAETMRAATVKALDATPESDFDKPAPEKMRSYAPKVGSVFAMIGTHVLMHVGQCVPLRRKLNKPIKM